jgi:N-acetylmuramoyl-L-alanine amidase
MSTLKIALDAGHGLNNRKDGVFDPGAVAGGKEEATIALEWALTGKFVLGESGLDVFLTRSTNSSGDRVSARAGLAAKAKCDRFISIHCNAATGNASGVEAFYRSSEDKAFAKIVLDCLAEATGLKSRGLKHESKSQHKKLAVLDFEPPACLIEIGFIDNPNDLKVITSKDVRVKFFTLLAEKMKAN